MTLTADALRDVLQDHSLVVDQALEQLFPDPDAPVNLDALRVLAGDGADLATVLEEVIETGDEHGDMTARLEAFLNARGIELIKRSEDETWDQGLSPFPGAVIAEPVPNDFPLEKVGRFALRASAFRCRIIVDGSEEGSGAFISKRLVLTAAHVVEKFTLAQAQAANDADMAALPKIEIKASDGQTFEARLAWASPVHDNERTGGLPPANAIVTHQDIAVLRVGLPIGLSYGYCDLPDPAVDWTGPRLMTLVHYPSGNRRGLTRGRVQRDTAQDVRLMHDVDTQGGSSGGLAFDRELQFIGIHQGRWDSFRRLVPHALFARNPDFVDTVQRDQPRRYLWSLEDDIESQIIVGRLNFFTGLTKMLEEPGSLLRGIWVRRLDTSTTTGLNFSFEMLTAFLKNRAHPSDPVSRHVCHRIPTDLEEQDLIADMARLVLGADAQAAHIGVRAGETSDVAEERDRAFRLAQELQKTAASQNATYWLFFETPPDDKLSDTARTQFEHLVEWLSTHRNLRIILAGFEQYALAPLKFQRIAEADSARRPGLLVDPLGQFTNDDVQVTLEAMLEDLNNEDNIEPLILQELVKQVTKNMQEVQDGVYSFDELGRAVDRIRLTVKLRAGLD